MPRKREMTAVQVLEYFGTAPLEAAKLVLQLAAQKVREREPKSKPTPATTERSRPTRGAAATAIGNPPPPVVGG